MFVLAHTIANPTAPDRLWSAWTLEPAVLLPLALAAVMYTIGVSRLWRAAGIGQGIRVWEAGAFAAACITVSAALMSPLDQLSAALLSAHMVQHELLILVAAPLFVLSAPLLAVAWALPSSARRRVVGFLQCRPLAAAWAALTSPAIVWLLHALALWVWHAPLLYDAALEHEAVHAIEHVCFFGTAALFWWSLTHSRYGRLAFGAAVVCVFTTAVHSGVLGALLALSARPWYPAYASTTRAWGFTPLEDQQLAGLTMWIPAGAIFVVAGLVFLAGWIQESERRTRFSSTAIERLPRYKTLVVPLIVCLLSGVAAAACRGDTYRTAARMTGGDPAQGQIAIAKYGCDTCHTIPGIRTARGLVGPPLTSVAARVYLAGHVPNTPANMQAWIRSPHRQEPHTVMPEMGVTEGDARDIAAYLYTLH